MRALRVSIISLILAFIAGCSQYQLGTPFGNESSIRVYIAPVKNKSSATQVTSALSAQIRRPFIDEPGIILMGSETQAEAILEVTIVGQSSRTLTQDPVDTGRPFSLERTLLIEYQWTVPGITLGQPRKLSFPTVLYARGGLADAEAQLAPERARTIAETIAPAALEELEELLQKK